MTSIEIIRLQPIQIATKEIGAYPTRDLFTVPFPGPRLDVRADGEIRDRPERPGSIELRRTARPPKAHERRRSLANLIYLHDVTGPGMSVVQNGVVGLFDLMSSTGSDPGRAASRLGIRPASEVQLDLLVECVVDGRNTDAVLTLWIGDGPPPIDWARNVETGGAWDADRWMRIGFHPTGFGLRDETNELGRLLLEAVRDAEGTRASDADPSKVHRTSFGVVRYSLPTVVQLGHGIMDRGDGYAPARSLTLEPVDATLGLGRQLAELSECDRRSFLAVLAEAALGDGHEAVPLLELQPDGSGLALPTSNGLLRLQSLDRYDRALLAVHAAAMLHGTRSTIVLVDGIDGLFPTEDLEFLHRSLGAVVDASPASTVMLNAVREQTITTFHRHAFQPGIVTGGAIASGIRI